MIVLYTQNTKLIFIVKRGPSTYLDHRGIFDIRHEWKLGSLYGLLDDIIMNILRSFPHQKAWWQAFLKVPFWNGQFQLLMILLSVFFMTWPHVELATSIWGIVTNERHEFFWNVYRYFAFSYVWKCTYVPLNIFRHKGSNV